MKTGGIRKRPVARTPTLTHICMVLQYDGTEYHGWQVQKRRTAQDRHSVATLQGVLCGVLRRITGRSVRLYSSSRTDSGVHADRHYVNAHVSTRLSLSSFKRACNALLPEDIAIIDVIPVKPEFHAQYHACYKTYRYTIWNGERVSPFMRRYAARVVPRLDVAAMRKAARLLKGRHDFTAFTRLRSRAAQRDPVRTVRRIIVRDRRPLIEIDMTADGFLHVMARSLAGFLVRVGTCAVSPEAARIALRTLQRKDAGPTMPAKGLRLLDVHYDFRRWGTGDGVRPRGVGYVEKKLDKENGV